MQGLTDRQFAHNVYTSLCVNQPRVIYRACELYIKYIPQAQASPEGDMCYPNIIMYDTILKYMCILAEETKSHMYVTVLDKFYCTTYIYYTA